jgi:phosphatidylinositol kinase/protein kinase (PI-3  family)
MTFFCFCFIVLGRAPGGSFSFETAPFKLTTEMVDVIGGRNSQNFKYFSDLCVKGALAARKHSETIYTLVEVMSFHSKLPCFLGNTSYALSSLRDRLFLNMSEEKIAPTIMNMIERSYDHFGTNKYDQYQVYSNGIAK